MAQSTTMCRPSQPAALGGREQMLAVDVGRSGVDADLAHPVPGRAPGWPFGVVEDRGQLMLHLGLEPDRQLGAERAEELDPVVAEGVVRGRDHGARAFCGARPPSPRRASAATPRSMTSAPSVANPAENAAWSSGPRTAGVAAHDEGRSGEDPGRGAAESQGQLGGQLFVGDAADAVGAEASRRHPPTAWSTAAPCGPSSGRTSSTPSRGRRG